MKDIRQEKHLTRYPEEVIDTEIIYLQILLIAGPEIHTPQTGLYIRILIFMDRMGRTWGLLCCFGSGMQEVLEFEYFSPNVLAQSREVNRPHGGFAVRLPSFRS